LFCQKIGRLLESVHHGEDDLALLREQARADRLLEQRVHPVGERSELALVESTEDAAGVDDGGVRKRRLQVEEDTAGNQASMESLQGVHDALKGQSSQRVREQSEERRRSWPAADRARARSPS